MVTMSAIAFAVLAAANIFEDPFVEASGRTAEA
jgi:hypothetical protein